MQINLHNSKYLLSSYCSSVRRNRIHPVPKYSYSPRAWRSAVSMDTLTTRPPPSELEPTSRQLSVWRLGFYFLTHADNIFLQGISFPKTVKASYRGDEEALTGLTTVLAACIGPAATFLLTVWEDDATGGSDGLPVDGFFALQSRISHTQTVGKH